MKQAKLTTAAIASVLSVCAFAGENDRPQGFKIGDRLTLKPYVSCSFTFDSNTDSTRHGKNGSNWSVNPGVAADYKGENWGVTGLANYQYHAYNRYSSQLNSSSWNEKLSFWWQDSMPDERGWTVLATESFSQIAQDDDMSEHNGRGLGRDRKEVTVNGVIERRLNNNVHLALDAGYYMLDYENNVHKYSPMYGWKRTNVGGEVGYMASKWTDFILSGGYQWYTQDNNVQRSRSYYRNMDSRGRKIDSDSDGWTIMGGIATRATERLEYRVLGGYNRFRYGDGTKRLGGFVYEFSARWRIEDRLSLMILGSSYYQPSENAYGSARKIYTASVGLNKSFIRGKVTGTIDGSYRKEKVEYAEYDTDNYDEDIWTGRVGLNYHINRFITCFARFEYQWMDSERKAYQYDRCRGTVGFRLSY